jgi:hypothetical protein
MKIIESLLLLALTVGLIFLWWKLFKLSNKKRRETLEIAAKQLNLMSREKITGKRVARLVFLRGSNYCFSLWWKCSYH